MAVKTKSERGPAGTLTVDDLTRAIKNSIDRTGMKEEEARAMAQHVLNFFGYSERIIDNVLEPEDRDAFYMLEDSGILTTEREETTLYDGREWRIHYWMFRKERIMELVAAQDGREWGTDRRLEGRDVACPRPGRGLRLLEQRGQAPLLDNETRVEPSEFEGDPAVDAPGAAHEPSIRRPSIKPCPPSKRFSTAFRIRR